MDIVLEHMKKHNIPLTRENYLALAYLGDPPDELGAEEEAEIPDEVMNPGQSESLEG
jgi:hypothetical protein